MPLFLFKTHIFPCRKHNCTPGLNMNKSAHFYTSQIYTITEKSEWLDGRSPQDSLKKIFGILESM